MMRKLACLFVLLMAVSAFATSVPADFQNSFKDSSKYHYDTTMNFVTGFTLSAPPSDVASGDPNNLQSNDKVCSGATVTITPTLDSKWAVSGGSIRFEGVDCLSYYCPTLISRSSGGSNLDLKWLDNATWGNIYSDGAFDQITGQTPGIDDYNSIGGDSAFSDWPATYVNSSGDYPNSEVGANVLCKGTYYVKDNGAVEQQTSPPAPSKKSFVVSGSGTSSIVTSLDNVQCMGAAVKHPLDNNNAFPEFFTLDIYEENMPSISSSIAQNTVDLNVVTSGGSCKMATGTVTGSASLSDSSQIMVKAIMDNTGSDPITVTGVTSSNSGYTAVPFPVSSCALLGFPNSVCPADNGFNESIGAGGSKPLYVLVTKGGGASGGTTLTFDAATSNAVCGGTSTCSSNADLTGAVFCGISPSSLQLGYLEWATFDVQCTDLASDPVSCGNSYSWSWGSGLSGGFFSTSNSMAEAYPTSSPGSSGTLDFKAGAAACSSNITVPLTEQYQCEFIPPAAVMNPMDSKYFQLNCFNNNNPQTPDAADYDVINGLSGSTSDSSTAGTNFTAGSPSLGNLRGKATFNGAPPPIGGAVALANIQVGNGGNGTNTTNSTNTNSTGTGGPGSTQYCTIGSGPLDAFNGFYGWLGIRCGKDANDSCSISPYGPVTWSITPGTGTLSGSSDNGTWVDITGQNGASGEIAAVVDSKGDGCSKPFTITPPLCWEVS